MKILIKVVAGIPPPKDQSREAQTQHVQTVANISLAMRAFLEHFEIPHRRRERVREGDGRKYCTWAILFAIVQRGDNQFWKAIYQWIVQSVL
jgi:hypothetical protein